MERIETSPFDESENPDGVETIAPQTKRERIEAELEEVRALNGGILKARDVVDYARDHEDSALHSKFDWDDTSAAMNFRVWQARQLIKVFVRVVKGGGDPVSVYVSLQDDRSSPGGGYRTTVDVLSNAEQRAKLLAQAMREAQAWRKKYKSLRELSEVFAALDEVER